MSKVTDVILVNEQDEPIGVMEKMEAHRKAVLHRAFSIFIFKITIVT
jgi:isopentenyl-diphosphate delta-isomerase